MILSNVSTDFKGVDRLKSLLTRLSAHLGSLLILALCSSWLSARHGSLLILALCSL